jgi:hypothetical protein
MMSFVYIFTTGSDTGTSVLRGPIGKTMNFLCFDEDTSIKLGSGTTVFMKDLKLGDALNNNTVVSVYAIDGTDVPMFLLGETKVSGGHKVMYNDKYIPVSEHPEAVPTTASKNLVCINTELRSFSIGPYQFMDFTEEGRVSGVSDPLLAQVQIGDTFDGEVVRGTVRHLVRGNVLYNLITEQSMSTSRVEKY